MKNFQTIGFIGGGRITWILLESLRRQKILPENIIVSDPDPEARERIRAIDPRKISVTQDDRLVVKSELIFLAVHAALILEVAGSIRKRWNKNSVFVSLIPGLSVEKLTDFFDGVEQIVRWIPNAPSLIGKGFNPITFSPAVSSEKKTELLSFFTHWGITPEVPEERLESYAILTGMGPTYFWFQWLELLRLGKEFGLTENESKQALSIMLEGAIQLLFHSSLSIDQVLQLIPGHPLRNHEETIRKVFRDNLSHLYYKMKT